MVGIVLVSHSGPLAQATAALGRLMAPDAPVACAGGLEDGGFGTSYDRIIDAINKVQTGDGVVVLMDMGSSVMTAKMVVEDLEDDTVRLADCPIVEGCVEAMVASQAGTSLSDLVKMLDDIREVRKL